MEAEEKGIKVIAKLEEGKVVLFFPESSANYGNIVGWDGQHWEASLGYYWGLHKPKDEDHVQKVIQWYERAYCCKLVRVQRDSDPMRQARWRRQEVCDVRG